MMQLETRGCLDQSFLTEEKSPLEMVLSDDTLLIEATESGREGLKLRCFNSTWERIFFNKINILD